MTSRPQPKRYTRKRNFLISEKSRLVRYYSLQDFHEHQTFQAKITHTMIRMVSAGIFPKIPQSVRQLKWDQWSAVANFPSLLGFWVISNPYLARVSAPHATCCPSCEPTRMLASAHWNATRHRNRMWHVFKPLSASGTKRSLRTKPAKQPTSAVIFLLHKELRSSIHPSRSFIVARCVQDFG